MILGKNINNKSIQKDKFKRILFVVLVGLFVVNTIFFIFDLQNTRNKDTGITNSIKQTQTVTKEVEKLVGNNMEKTKEIVITEKPNNITGLIIYLFMVQTPESAFIRYIFKNLILLIFYWLLGLTIRGVNDVSILGVGIKADQSSTLENQHQIENQRTKLDILRHWITPGNQAKFSSNVQSSQGSKDEKGILQYLEVMFSELQETYAEQFHIHFDFSIMTKEEMENSDKIKRVIKKSIVALDDVGTGISIGKEQNLPFHQNYLIYKVEGLGESGIIEYIIVLSSYVYEFDEDDTIVIAALSSMAATIHTLYAQAQLILNNNQIIEQLKFEIEANNNNL